MLHEVLLHAEGHFADGALVRLARRVNRPLVLVHRVGVGELAVALRALDHDALVEDPDVFGQLRADGVRLLALAAVVGLLHAVHPNFVSEIGERVTSKSTLPEETYLKLINLVAGHCCGCR